MKKRGNLANKEIKKIIHKIKKEKNIKAVYLFGSYAKGRAKPYSDIDICIITDKKLTLENKASFVSDHISEKIDMPMFWDLPISIRFRVFKEGRLLLCKDKLFLQRIKVDTIKRYLDFKPVLERYSKRVLSG